MSRASPRRRAGLRLDDPAFAAGDVENAAAEHEADAGLPAASNVASLNGVSGLLDSAARWAPTRAVTRIAEDREHQNGEHPENARHLAPYLRREP